MTCEVDQQEECVCFTLKGALHEQEAAVLKERFQSLPHEQVREVVFDLEGLTFVSSTGLGCLLKFQRQLAERGARMRLVRTPQFLDELLTRMRLNALLNS